MIAAVYVVSLTGLIIMTLNALRFNKIRLGGAEISLSDTTILKGCAILLVVVGHVGQTIPELRAFTPFGAWGVGIFLVCSGYGIEKSVEKNGRVGYWCKRITNVWVPYAIVELLALPLHWQCGYPAILADFLLIRPLHPFGWYMRFLFVWYILYYVFSYADKYKLPLLILSGIGILCACSTLHAQNAFSFATGVALAKINTLERFWKSRYVWIGMVMGIMFFLARDYVKNSYSDVNLVKNLHYDVRLLWNALSLLFNSTLVLTSIAAYKVLTNKSLKLPYSGFSVVGAFSYELYLVHGYAYKMIETPATVISITIFVLACVLGSFLLNKFDHFMIKAINQKLSRL